jgi:PST family polysaccharide transporter
MGSYNVSADVSSMATREIVDAMGRGLYPNLAKLADSPEKLATAFLHVLNAVAVMCLAFGLGLYAVAGDFVLVVLGSQWVSAVPLVEWLALYMALGSIINVLSSHILVVTGHERASAVLMWMRIAIMIPAVVAAGTLWGVEAIAAAAAGSALVNLVISFFYAARALPVSTTQLIGSLWRPTAASGAMVFGIDLLHMDQLGLPLITLALDVAAGAIIYSFCLLLLWRVSGKPPGLEKGIMDSISRLAGRFRITTRGNAS